MVFSLTASIGVFHKAFLYVWYCWCAFESSFLLLFLTYCARIPQYPVPLSLAFMLPNTADTLPGPPADCTSLPLPTEAAAAPAASSCGGAWLATFSPPFSGFASSLLHFHPAALKLLAGTQLPAFISSPSLPVCLLPYAHHLKLGRHPQGHI